MTGKVVYSATTETTSLQINTSDLTAGLYNLQIVSGEKTINKKVVIR
jgi:hypothetical protein